MNIIARIRNGAVVLLVVAETALTFPVFLVSWLGSAVFRSVIAGWQVSLMPRELKVRALKGLLGESFTMPQETEDVEARLAERIKDERAIMSKFGSL